MGKKPRQSGGDYAAERYDPNMIQCSNLTLVFDGTNLTMRGAPKTYSYAAVSGRPGDRGTFNYSSGRQRIRNVGPIPEGQYWINPEELWENAWYKFSASSAAWGNFRITIHPYPDTVTFGRGGFFIHGGDVRGSAGCIDLTSAMDAFASRLRRETTLRRCHIPLRVSYP